MSGDSFNAYLKRSGDDAGMAGDLRMNKKIIVDVGDSSSLANGANIKRVDSLASATLDSVIPPMTSPNTPPPYQIYGSPNGGTMWQMFDQNPTTAWTSPDGSSSVTINILANEVKLLDCIYVMTNKIIENFILSNVSGLDSLTLGSVGVVNAGGFYMRLAATERVQNMRITFDCQGSTTVSEISIYRKTIDVGGDCVLHVGSDSSVFAATNIQYVQNVVRPLSSVISGSFINPPMFSDSQEGYLTSASVELVGYESYRPFNFDFSSMWVCPTVTGSVELTIPSPRQPKRVQMLGRVDDIAQFASWNIQASDDGTTWEIIYAGSGSLPSVLTTYDLTTTRAYVKFRFFGFGSTTASQAGLTTFNLAEDRINFNSNRLSGIGVPTDPGDAVPKWYVDGAGPGQSLLLTGGTMTGPISMTNRSYITQDTITPLSTSLLRAIDSLAYTLGINAVLAAPLERDYGFFQLTQSQASLQQPLLLKALDFGTSVSNPKNYSLSQSSLITCPVGYNKVYGYVVVGATNVVVSNVEVIFTVSNVDQLFATDGTVIPVGSGLAVIPFVFYVPTTSQPLRCYVTAGVGADVYVATVYVLSLCIESLVVSADILAVAMQPSLYAPWNAVTLPPISNRLLFQPSGEFDEIYQTVNSTNRTVQINRTFKAMLVLMRINISVDPPSFKIWVRIFKIVGGSSTLLKSIPVALRVQADSEIHLSVSEFVNMSNFSTGDTYCVAIASSKALSIVDGSATFQLFGS
jgi:hypothetical protein